MEARRPVVPLWDLLTSMRFSLVVMLAMAILGLVGPSSSRLLPALRQTR